MRRFLGAGVALVCGVQAAVAVFFAPVLIYGDDQVLLLWGWIAPVVALPAAFVVGWLVRSIVNGLLAGHSSSNIVTLRRFAVVAVVVVTLVTAISYVMLTHGDQDIRWSEEVALRDGTRVVVSRRVIGNSFGRPKVQPDSWLPSTFEIDMSALPSLSHAPVWRSSLRPVLLERNSSDGTWVLLAEPKHCGEWYDLGKPAPPYGAYELRGGAWVQVAVRRELLGYSANLLVAPRFTGERPTIGAAEIADRNTVGPRDAWPVIKADSAC
jgi:hypothetical protein